MPLFQGLGFPRLGFQVRVDLRLVGVVISEGRMNLRQRQVAKLPDDLLRDKAHVVPLSDAADGNTRSGNARPATANAGAARDQATYRPDEARQFDLTKYVGP